MNTSPKWKPVSRYEPTIPQKMVGNPDYSIRGAWELYPDGVMRFVYRGYYRQFPIHEIDSSTDIVPVQYAVEDFAEGAAYSGNGLLVH